MFNYFRPPPKANAPNALRQVAATQRMASSALPRFNLALLFEPEAVAPANAPAPAPSAERDDSAQSSYRLAA